MRLLLLSLCVACVAAIANAAPACTLRMTDISMQLKAGAGSPTVMSTQRFGAGSEVVRRYTLTYNDGSMIVMEQQDCTGSNLRLSLLSLAEKPTLLELNRLAAVLSATSLWREHFTGSNAAVLLQTEVNQPEFTARAAKGLPFFYGVDDRISAMGTPSNVSLGFALGNTATQFRSMLTFTFGIRGA